MYTITRNGEIIQHVVFEGISENDLYKKAVVKDLTFTTEKQAKEIASLWKDATVTEKKIA